MTIYDVSIDNPLTWDALAYTNGYFEGTAKEFMIAWRNKDKNAYKTLINFLNDLRKFCIPKNDTDKNWEEFQLVRQTVNGKSRHIQEVATEL